MGYILTLHGQERTVNAGLQLTYDYGLYNDTTDSIVKADTDPATDITTEPSGAAYARQSVTVTGTETGVYSGNNGFEVSVTYDTSDSTGTVNGVFAVEGTEIHHTAGPFSQDRDLSQIDQLDVTITVTIE